MNYESTFGAFPPARIDVTGPPGPLIYQTSWTTLCLPYFDQTPVYAIYNFNAAFDDPSNIIPVSTKISAFLCPSAPSSRMTPGAGVVSDNGQPWPAVGQGYCDYGSMNSIRPCYFVSNSVTVPPVGLATNTNQSPTHAGVNSMLNSPSASKYEWDGGLKKWYDTKISDLTDGTSNTMMVVEDAGRPQLFRLGKSAGSTVKDGWGWADIQGGYSLDGASADALTTGKASCTVPSGPCSLTTVPTPYAVNMTNDSEMYAFHVGGAQILLCDGSVRFISQNIGAATLAALATRNVGDLVGDF